MPYRLTKIYTKKGDEGYTGMADKRISKDDSLIEAIGEIDELNSVIGFLIALQPQEEMVKLLLAIQNKLFDMGGELHQPKFISIQTEDVNELERNLDSWNETLPPLAEFVLPGGNTKAAYAHIARTVCRRAERALVRLHRQTPLNNPEMLRYLNRLSDLLFVLARVLARETNENEALWQHDRQK